MSKVTTVFRFPFPLKRKFIESLKFKTINVAELTVECTYYGGSHYAEVDAIYFEGKDIKPVLEAINEDFLSDLQDSANKLIDKIFQNHKEAA